jgi:hypothetical protein
MHSSSSFNAFHTLSFSGCFGPHQKPPSKTVCDFYRVHGKNAGFRVILQQIYDTFANLDVFLPSKNDAFFTL